MIDQFYLLIFKYKILMNTCGLYCILILFILIDKIKFEDIIISFVYLNGKRAFIFHSNDDIDTSHFVTIPKHDYRYLNVPISEIVNMNNRKINNCNEGEDDKDVCTIKSLTLYYKKELTLNMSNQKITHLPDETDQNDAVNFK